MCFSDKIAAFIANQAHFCVFAVVCFMAGILAYFVLPFEPNPLLVMVSLVVVTGVWIAVRHRLLVRYGVCFFFFFVLGFANIAAHTAATHTVMPRHMLKGVFVTGTVTDSVSLRRGQTVELDVERIKGVPRSKTPNHIKVSARFAEPELAKGMRVRALVTLFPINRPMRSLAPDMSLTAFYTGTGMSGILHKAWVQEESNTPTVGVMIEHMRETISDRVDSLLPRETQGVAKALIIGEQRDILDHTRFLYRLSGIYHVLSVSGLHMTLIALIFFFVFTHLLSLSVWLDEKITTRKIAAVATWFVALFYLLLSGMQTPALRAFMMLSFVLLGVVIGRNALSVRAVALAAFVILLVKPYLILTASFQLSFSAVLILICVYQRVADKLMHDWVERGWLFKALAAVIGLMLASLLATLATLPYVGYHFHQITPYGIIGNLATGFLFTFGVMPLLAAATVLMPLGWDAPFLQVAGYLLFVVNHICEQIVVQPFATIVIPAFHPWGVAVASLGIVIICLLRGRASVLTGVGILGLSLLAFVGVPKPDFMVAENGKLFAMRDTDDGLLLSESYLNRFVSDNWLLMNSQNPADYWLPKAFRPDKVTIDGVAIGLSDKACSDPDVAVVIGVTKSRNNFVDCTVPVIRRTDFTRDGMHEFYVENGRVRIEKPGLKDVNRAWRINAQ